MTKYYTGALAASATPAAGAVAKYCSRHSHATQLYNENQYRAVPAHCHMPEIVI